MKFIIALILCINGMTQFLMGKELETVSCKKTYFSQDQLHLVESTFWVHIDGVWVQPTSLHTDGSALYFDTIRHEVCPGPWQCSAPGCHNWNEEWRTNCKRCGRSR